MIVGQLEILIYEVSPSTEKIFIFLINPSVTSEEFFKVFTTLVSTGLNPIG